MPKLEELLSKYPTLYNSHHPAYGFECDDGWYDILDRLSAIAFEEFRRIKEEDNDLNPIVLQVKEKFGGLRFYTSQTSKRLTEAIRSAERESTHTCEKCGGMGKTLDTGGWWVTLCDPCFAARKAAMKAQSKGAKKKT